MLLSIIVPMYNVSQYLEKCIKNIQIDNIEYEILMIDDGSPDNSISIANDLARINKRIKVFSQKNKGLGGARNLGIKNATGKYILFLDADDILIKQDFQFLDEEVSEIIEFSSKNITSDNNIISEFNAENVTNPLDGISYYNIYPSMFSVCNKLYSKTFLSQYNLLFKEQIYIEDFEFNTRTFFFCKRIKSFNESIQYFVQVENSITRNSNKERKVKLVNDMIKVGYYIRDFTKNMKLSNLEMKFIQERFCYLTVDVIFHTLKNNLGNKFLLEKTDELKNSNLYNLDCRLKHRKKDFFRKILKFPFGLFIIKYYLKIKYDEK